MAPDRGAHSSIGAAATAERGGDRSRREGVPPIADALIRAVLDTNVLISSEFFGGVPATIVQEAARGAFALVTSDALLDELERVLVSRFGVPREVAALSRAALAASAELATPAAISGVVRDRSDDVVLATALGGSADRIVTGDRDLLALGGYGRIKMVSPRAFLDELASRKT